MKLKFGTILVPAALLVLGACGQSTLPGSNQKPVASFTADPTNGTSPLQLEFDASSSTDPDGSIASYVWDFGDDASGEGMTANHTFSDPGSYTVSLTVTDDMGATGTSQRTLDVTGVNVGSLAVEITGLSPAAEADVLVTGPGEFSRHLAASGTLTDLMPGSYVVSAALTESDDARFMPADTIAEVEIMAGQAETLDVAHSCVAVLFADEDLELEVRGELGKADGAVSCSELAALTSLSADQITDLSGIQHATGLERLSISGDDLSGEVIEGVDDLTPLRTLSALTSLTIFYSFVTDLGPLSDLAALRTLHIRDHSITDLSPLEGLAGLETLNLDDGSISDLGPLTGLSGLKSLSISRNAVSDISPLADLVGLESLGLQSNSIQEIGSLSSITSLESLWLDSNPLRDVSPLAGMTQLTYLSIIDGGIGNSDLTAVQNLTNLRGLLLDMNDIGILTPLSGLTGLTYLRLGRNEITDISPLAGLVRLGSIFLSDNNISDIGPMQSLTDLELASLEGNHITDIQPLIDNVGLGADDRVRLACNELDLTPGSSSMDDIEALVARGVRVTSAPQKPDASCD